MPECFLYEAVIFVLQFGVPRWLPFAVTKNRAEHENDNSHPLNGFLPNLCQNDSCMELFQNLIRIDLSSLHPFLKIAKYETGKNSQWNCTSFVLQ